ncbi:pilin, partial [Neisseria gonorrhoeae]
PPPTSPAQTGTATYIPSFSRRRESSPAGTETYRKKFLQILRSRFPLSRE